MKQLTILPCVPSQVYITISPSVWLGFLRNRFSAPPLASLSILPIAGKTVIVTGASTGLGLEAARHFVRLGSSRVILAVRSKAKGEAAREKILSDEAVSSSATKGSTKSACVVDVWILDLSSFASVKAFANRIHDEVDCLDIAVLNAGVSKSKFELTEDGWEESNQVNMLSNILLGMLLLPKLRESSEKQPGWTPHLSIVASRAHQNVRDGEPWQEADNMLEYLNQPSSWGAFGDRYSLSKLLLVYGVLELAKMTVEPSGKINVIVNYSCPGACMSNLARDWDTSWTKKALLFLIQNTICKTTEEGGRTLVYASALGEESHGRWIHNDQFEELGGLAAPGNAKGQKLRAQIWKETLAVFAAQSGSSMFSF